MTLRDYALLGGIGLMLACRPGSVQEAGEHTTIETAVPTLPSDPFRACAVKALRGDYGPLPDWKLDAYRRGLEQGVTVKPGRAWVTHYWPAEGRDGQVDRRGNRCTERTAAANLLPYGTYVWLENPCGLRQILDCGAKRNDRQARRYGAELWIDRWNPGPKGNYVSGYAVISHE